MRDCLVKLEILDPKVLDEYVEIHRRKCLAWRAEWFLEDYKPFLNEIGVALTQKQEDRLKELSEFEPGIDDPRI